MWKQVCRKAYKISFSGDALGLIKSIVCITLNLLVVLHKNLQ